MKIKGFLKFKNIKNNFKIFIKIFINVIIFLLIYFKLFLIIKNERIHNESSYTMWEFR